MPSKKQRTNIITQHGKVQVEGRGQRSKPLQTHQSLYNPRQVPIELLQHVLDIFSNTFSSQVDPALPKHIQEVKQHLYNRDFDNAFGREKYREAYSMRWSPSRALAYTNVFYNLQVLAERILATSSNELVDHNCQEMAKAYNDKRQEKPIRSSRIVCIGAGAGAEIVALGAYLKCLEKGAFTGQENPEGLSALQDSARRLRFDVNAIDVADWESVVSRLHSGVTTAPPLSRYASAEKEAANRPLADPSMYQIQFLMEDILHMKLADLTTSFKDATLVTLMFTLNELYSNSMKATTNLLLSITMNLSPGTLLLVTDSPGSYSTVKIGAASGNSNEQKYPMQWLLDHTLLKSAATNSSNGTSRNQWEKLEDRESEWFRLPKGLSYPIDLEDMRYQIHLYRRL